jgi:cytochrome c2
VAVLTLLLAAWLAPAPGAAVRSGADPGCLRCHAPHHTRHGTCVACHRGHPRATREALAHHRLLRGAAAAWGMPDAPVLAEGERLRDASGCRRCHVTGDQGNPLAIALDDVVWKRDQDGLRGSILRPVSTMPDFGFTTEQADRLIAVLLRDAAGRPASRRYLVRFRTAPRERQHPFERLCGGCHRVLTPGGPLGGGTAGPDLSGLLTPYYPARGGRAWDRARLARWLEAPRREDPRTTMRPVRVTPAELDAIAPVLGAPPARGWRPRAATR